MTQHLISVHDSHFGETKYCLSVGEPGEIEN
jgi:hypothetical protein